MPKQYILIVNPFQKELLDHALNFCIDSQHKMGAITPKMAADLGVIQNKIMEGGEIIEIRYTRHKPMLNG